MIEHKEYNMEPILNPSLIQNQLTALNKTSAYTPIQSQPIDLLFIDSQEAAWHYKLPPNSRVALFSKTKDIFYIVESDSTGNTISVKAKAYQDEVVEIPFDKRYASAESLKDLSDKFDKLMEELTGGK